MSSKNSKLTILEHLTELRKRLVKIAIVNLIATLICYQFIHIIMPLILNLSKGMDLIYISPSELFLVYVKLAIICGIVISSPITLLEVWLFVSKGLYKKEKIYIVLSLIVGIIFFAVGVIFCYIVVLPITINFFIGITIEDIEPMISISSFISFISTMLLSFGAVFEIPIVAFLLSIIGLLKPQMLIKKHSIIILIIFIVAAVITPPDVVSLTLLAIPMVILFELSIGICWGVNKIKDKKKNK